jgi:hypothetical protein
MDMKKFIKENSLTIVFIILFILAMVGQILTGHKEYLKELSNDNAPGVSLINYLKSGHFFQATFENWESEFLQMGLFIWLTVFLRQKGSSESKKIDESNETDQEPDPLKPGAPWPVRKGGFILKIYENSLTITFFLLFIASWALHLYGSYRDENVINILKGKPTVTVLQHMISSRMWFESFQNWQSEFLSVFSIVILSIFLRQKGSSQSKSVDAPIEETGD